jgi:hypothetical protein
MDLQLRGDEFGEGRDSFSVTGFTDEIQGTVQHVWASGLVLELAGMASSSRSGQETWVFELKPGSLGALRAALEGRA